MKTIATDQTAGDRLNSEPEQRKSWRPHFKRSKALDVHVSQDPNFPIGTAGDTEIANLLDQIRSTDDVRRLEIAASESLHPHLWFALQSALKTRDELIEDGHFRRASSAELMRDWK